jgi:hypothetical protein
MKGKRQKTKTNKKMTEASNNRSKVEQNEEGRRQAELAKRAARNNNERQRAQ